jgi:hypothetical protein
MRNDRITPFFFQQQTSNSQLASMPEQGFIPNPFVVSPAQALIYQAAFLQAQRSVRRSPWREAKCWN